MHYNMHCKLFKVAKLRRKLMHNTLEKKMKLVAKREFYHLLINDDTCCSS